jgi:hypothetical protein
MTYAVTHQKGYIAMTEVLHGLLSGLIWSAILGACLFAIAAVVTTIAPTIAGAMSRRWNRSRRPSIAQRAHRHRSPVLY